MDDIEMGERGARLIRGALEQKMLEAGSASLLEYCGAQGLSYGAVRLWKEGKWVSAQALPFLKFLVHLGIDPALFIREIGL
jgi:hypothetical protein